MKDPNKPKTILQKKKEFRKRFDEFVNDYTGIGSRTRDPQSFTRFLREPRLTDDELSNFYHGNDIFARLAEVVPNEALKMGFKIETGENAQSSELDSIYDYEDEDPAVKKQLRDIFMKLDELKVTQKCQQAWIWGNVFGAGILYLGINDGNKQDSAVDWNRIQSVDFIQVLDRRYVRPSSVYSDPENPKYGETAQYAIRAQPNTGIGTPIGIEEAIIHESRIVFFEGAETAKDRRQENEGWADSIFQRLQEPIRHMVTSFQSVANMMSKSAQGKMKMAGLIDSMGANTPQYVEARLTDMMLRASNNMPFVFDANENEDYTLESYSFNGIPQLQELFMLRVCSALRTPYSILFGQSPAGMNATGDMEVRTFYDQVRNKQLYVLKPILEYIVRAVMLSKKGPTGGKEMDQWSVCFPSPWQLTDMERAQIEKLKAESRKLTAEAEKIEETGLVPTIATNPAVEPPSSIEEN